MRSLLLVCLCGASALWLCAAPRLRADTGPADGEREKSEMTAVADSTDAMAGEVVVRVRHSRGLGPCILLGTARARTYVDEFEVIEIVKGQFKPSRMIVRGPYSNDLSVGATYTLRLKPSKQTVEELWAQAKDDTSFLSVNRGEITVKKDDK